MTHLINIKSRMAIKEYTLLLFRIGVSLLMLYGHGYPKLQKIFSGAEIQFADPFGLGMKMSFYLVVFAEVICSIFIILGLKTRMASSVLVFNMLVATFVMASKGEVPELALMYFFCYVLILIFGAGKYSVDYNLNSKKKGKF
ncbi:MAG: DoxX family protein [Bacteroidetes bacterium]|nr:DoxX family protein [Bacteroidota bacterium]MBX7237846.1 DoxX family protein [Bacteroidia bacterium]MCC7513725.1 DoxX family protein [Bacteroidia bacterium]MCW5918237.1 DoxX family protein [Bacteroidota bacterium]HMU76858.1 DoxX family protein [Bacteroidia bacterium]